MPDITPRLGLKKPLGTENVTRTAYSENLDLMDANAAKKTDLDAASASITAHASATTGAHGATSAATPSAVMQRDANGRAKVAAPAAADDIAQKATVDNHAAITNGAHGATAAATASTIIQRDSSGRAKVAAPAASDDIARKDTVDNAVAPKLDASTYTAADVLAKLLTVDGVGTGLDADKVRGIAVRENSGVFEYSTDDGGAWQPVGLIANKPRSANLEQATSSTGVWYTVLDITSGKGRLSRAAAGIPNTSSTNELVEIRITVDGDVQVHKPTTANHMRGLYHSGNRYGQYVIDLFFSAEFLSNLKVEVRQTTSFSPDLQAIVDYALAS